MTRHPIVAFRTAAAALPGERLIVFVRYAENHPVNWSLITNDADLADARIWSVYDRGADNLRLMRIAPARVPYRFDEATNTFTRLDIDSVVAPESPGSRP